MRLSCCLLLTEALYLTWIKRQHWHLVCVCNMMCYIVSSCLAMVTWGTRAGGSFRAQWCSKLQGLGTGGNHFLPWTALQLWQRSGIWIFGFHLQTTKSKATQKLYEYISFNDICRIFVSYLLVAKLYQYSCINCCKIWSCKYRWLWFWFWVEFSIDLPIC